MKTVWYHMRVMRNWIAVYFKNLNSTLANRILLYVSKDNSLYFRKKYLELDDSAIIAVEV